MMKFSEMKAIHDVELSKEEEKTERLKRKRRVSTVEEKYQRYLRKLSKDSGVPIEKLEGDESVRTLYNLNAESLRNGGPEMIISNFTNPNVFDINRYEKGLPNALNPNFSIVNGLVLPTSVLTPSVETGPTPERKMIDALLSNPKGQEEKAIEIADEAQNFTPSFTPSGTLTKVKFTPYHPSKNLIQLRQLRDEKKVTNFKMDFKQALEGMNVNVGRHIVPFLEKILGRNGARDLIESVSRIEALYPTESVERVYSKIREIIEYSSTNTVVFDPVFESFYIFLAFNQLTKNQRLLILEPNKEVISYLGRRALSVHGARIVEGQVNVLDVTSTSDILETIKNERYRSMVMNLEFFRSSDASEMLILFIALLNKMNLYATFNLIVGMPFKIDNLSNIYNSSAFNYEVIHKCLSLYFKFYSEGYKYDEGDINEIIEQLKGKIRVTTESSGDIVTVPDVDEGESVFKTPTTIATEIPEPPSTLSLESKKTQVLRYNLERAYKVVSSKSDGSKEVISRDINSGDFYVIMKTPIGLNDPSSAGRNRPFVIHPIYISSEHDFTAKGTLNTKKVKAAMTAKGFNKIETSSGYGAGYLVEIKESYTLREILKVVPRYDGKYSTTLQDFPQLTNQARTINLLYDTFIDHCDLNTPEDVIRKMISEKKVMSVGEEVLSAPSTPTSISSPASSITSSISRLGKKLFGMKEEEGDTSSRSELSDALKIRKRGTKRLEEGEEEDIFPKLGVPEWREAEEEEIDKSTPKLKTVEGMMHDEGDEGFHVGEGPELHEIEGGSLLTPTIYEKIIRLFRMKHISQLDVSDGVYWYHIGI